MKTFHDQPNNIITFLDERFYTEDGVTYFPSVTTVLGDVYPKGYGYNQWLKDLGMNADEVLKRAGEAGSRIHNAIDKFVKGDRITWVSEEGNVNYQLEEWKMILKAYEFFTEFKPKILANEESLVSKTMRIGGTIDLVCEIDGVRWLIDYKSSNAIYKTHELQVSKYAQMWNEKNPTKKIDRVGVLHLKATSRGADKTGKVMQGKGWKVVTYERSYEEAAKVFDYTRAIWDEEHPTYLPKNQEFPDFIELKTHI